MVETSYDHLAPPLFSVIIVVGFVGNVLLIYTVVRWRRMRTPCNYLILNNALGDLGVVLIAAPLRIVEVYHGWPLGQTACQLLAPMQDVFVVVSVLTYTFIAWERYKAVVTPLKAFKPSFRSTLLAALLCWVLAYLTSGLPIALSLRLTEFNGKTHCLVSFSSDLSRQIYETYLVVVFIVLPLCLQTFAYGKIVHTLRNQKRFNVEFQSGSRTNDRRSRMRKRRLIRVTIVLIVAFQICFIPRAVVMLLYEFARDVTSKEYFKHINLVLLAMYYVKHIINPLILFSFSTEFRKHFPCKLSFCPSRQTLRRHWSSRSTAKSIDSSLRAERNAVIVPAGETPL